MNGIARATSTALLIFTTFNVHAGRDAGDLEAEYFFDHNRKVTATPIDWSQPPLGCVEEMIPHPASRACLDLTQVANPLKDWPANLPQPEYDYWFAQRRELLLCRAVESLRREAAQPGSQTAGAIEASWMATEAIKDYDIKVDAIYDASETYRIPAHVLAGAIYQESMFATLGLADDGGNFSCGMQQINLLGWCEWANAQTTSMKSAMDWPTSGVDCSDTGVVNLVFIKPLYEIAKTKLNGLPEYRLNKTHFQGIQLKDVEEKWPAADAVTNNLRLRVINSFVNHCSEPRIGIMAKARELKSLYSAHVSTAFKNKDRYKGGIRFQRQCRRTSRDDAHPLHTGWLMAVASYNAGPRAVDAVTYYNKWSAADFDDINLVRDFTGDKVVESIYWSGKYNPAKDRIDYATPKGSARNWIWFKGCVAQRHVARVMQHMTLLPNFFVDSLEGAFPCAKSKVDADGKILTSVPPFRQTSTGVKDP